MGRTTHLRQHSQATRLVSGNQICLSYETITLYRAAFLTTYALAKIPFSYISVSGLSRRALLSSVALTKSILVSFFSSA